MEFKAIAYIIMGIVYFIYSMNKKAQENKQSKQQAPTADNTNTPSAKPVSPPAGNPLEDIMREIKRKQVATEAAKKAAMPQPKPLTTFQQNKEPKEILVHQKQKGVFAEGNYERGLTDEEKIERGKLKIENEGIYKIKTADEMNVEESDAVFQINMRDAIIGSVILERKF